MSRRSILTPVITAAFFAVSTPAIGVDALLVELSSEASRPATNDLMQATVSAEASGASPGDLSAQINQSVAEALSAAKAFPTIKIKTGNTTTYPVHSKQGKIESWRMRSDIVLESSDATVLSGLLGKLQKSLTVTSLIASPSHETRRKAENEAMIDAIALSESAPLFSRNNWEKAIASNRCRSVRQGTCHDRLCARHVQCHRKLLPCPWKRANRRSSSRYRGKSR
jgi:predicted secreted protein